MAFIVTIILSYLAAMLMHELGHLVVARLCRVPVSELGLGWGSKLYKLRVREIEYCVRTLPVGAYVRLNMRALQDKRLSHQICVMVAGIFVNLAAATMTQGTIFGLINLLMASSDLLPIYQQDGWKCGVLIMRHLLHRKSELVEWTFTLTGGLVSFCLLITLVRYIFNPLSP